MTYVDELQRELTRVRRIEDLAPILVRVFSELAERLRAAQNRFESGDVQIQDLRDRIDAGSDRVFQLEQYVVAVDGRLSALETRLRLVDVLPVDAPLGALMRLRVGTQAEKLPLYLGNGTGQPLTKLTPTVV